MNLHSPWAWATVAGIGAIVCVYFVGVSVGEKRAGMRVETRTVTVDNTKMYAAELAEARQQAAMWKNRATNVKVVAETFGPPVPGCAQPPLASRTTTVDLSTEDLRLTLDTSAKASKTTIGETSHASLVETKPVARDWTAGGGVLLSPRAEVVGAYGQVSRRILGNVGAVVTVARARGNWTAGVGVEWRF